MAIDTPSLATIGPVIETGPFAAQWDSLRGYRVPDWYQDAKFGIFIHWGLYAVPAFGNEWYARHMYKPDTAEYAHHRATYGPQDQFGYKDFIPRFTAEHFDPEAWADLFRRSGARYVVPVAEHHDGFALYDSRLTPWTSVQMGPKRDIIGELARATRAQGMVFGLSTHRAEHWWFFDGGRTFPSDVQDPRFESFYGPAQPTPTDSHDTTDRPPSEEFLQEWLVRTCELIDLYEPQIVWFDWWIHNLAFKPYLQQLAAYYYNRGAQWQRGVAINYKYDAYEEGTAVFDVERGQLKGIRPDFWQTDTSVSSKSWGYIDGDTFRSPTDLIHDLVDIVSKNGSLLLNVGPRADGTIPEEAQAILLAIGAWLAVNGEAIYGTRPWTRFGEGPTEIVEGAFAELKRAPFTGQDIRFTTRGTTLYATLLGWPEDGQITINALGSGQPDAPVVRDVSLLGSAAPVAWSQTAAGLSVTLPETHTGAHAWVLKLTP